MTVHLDTPVDISSQVRDRIEALSLSRVHAKLGGALGMATFFDGFDALTIAYILPVLIREWHLTPGMAGVLIAAGYAGQSVGAILFGALAQNRGRITAIRWSIMLFASMSVLCALAPSYGFLLAARAVQGIGLGGEMPVAATYIGEMIGRRQRSRLFFLYQGSFGVGILASAAAAALLLPDHGWRWMFWIGAVPILVIPVINRFCPESPQWLAGRGRNEEAEISLSALEGGTRRARLVPAADICRPPAASAIEPATFLHLFSSGNFRRTTLSCLLWAIAAIGTYGLGAWTPTILTGYFEVPIADALILATITGGAVALTPLALVFLSARLSLKALLIGTFAISAVMLLPIGIGLVDSSPKALALWLLFAAICIAQLGLTAASATLYLYTTSLYPVQLRALGTGLAAACQRSASIATPLAIGLLLQYGSPPTVFLLLAGIAGIGAVCVKFWGYGAGHESA